MTSSLLTLWTFVLGEVDNGFDAVIAVETSRTQFAVARALLVLVGSRRTNLRARRTQHAEVANGTWVLCRVTHCLTLRTVVACVVKEDTNDVIGQPLRIP